MMIGNPRKVVQFLLPTASGGLRRPRDFWIGWYATVGHWGHVRASGVAHATSVGVWRRLAVIVSLLELTDKARRITRGHLAKPSIFKVNCLTWELNWCGP